MSSLINKGDFIAHEFTRLMGGTTQIKTASDSSSPMEKHTHDDASDCDSDDCGYAEDDLLSDGALSELVLDDNAEDSDAATPLDKPIKAMKSYSDDSMDHSKEASHIIDGLNKIASDLRNKGEDFAADVVEATSLELINDFKKEAAEKRYIINSLTKIASEFDGLNDRFAADLVRVTINKIN
jgi:hypothetical protein